MAHEMCDGMQTHSIFATSFFFLLFVSFLPFRNFAFPFQCLSLWICCVWTALFQHWFLLLLFIFSICFKISFLGIQTSLQTNGREKKKFSVCQNPNVWMKEWVVHGVVVFQLVAWQYKNEVLAGTKKMSDFCCCYYYLCRFIACFILGAEASWSKRKEEKKSTHQTTSLIKKWERIKYNSIGL